jgi:Tfp pilus assembly protein PilF
MNRNRARIILVYTGLALVTVVAYQPVCSNGFVNYDDNTYVTDNTNIKNGFTLQSLSWAFTSQDESNWHPLTWISHILDYQLFGLNPLGHHFMSVLLHIANTLLLFYVLHKTTTALWPSAFAACLFAIHPLHVESVAWISERKDVLSTLFGLLAMLAYIRYTRGPTLARYTGVLILFSLGLMAKPMLVTLPFVFLIIDYWPLNRPLKLKLLLEKIPLLILTSASCIMTYIAQKSGGSVTNMEVLSLGERISNALLSYVSYIGKIFYPVGLAVFYPHPTGALPIWKAILAAILLAAITVGTICTAGRRRYLLVGWLWYLGTLVPVIGIVQVGEQASADRYTYLPSIGLFIMLAWSAAEVIGKIRAGRFVLTISSALIITVLSVCTRVQVSYWRNSMTLFKHAIEVTKNNYMMHYLLGCEFAQQGRLDDGINQFRRAIEIFSAGGQIHYDLANTLRQKGKINAAIEEYRLAVKYKSNDADAHNDFGYALLSQGNFDEAKAQFSEALKINPNHSYALTGLAQVLIKHPKPDFRDAKAAVELAEHAAMLTKNQNPVVLETLATSYAIAGRFDLAVKTAQEALTLASTARHNELASRLNNAIKQYQQEQANNEPSVKMKTNGL